jgi:hypothetical protein
MRQITPIQAAPYLELLVSGFPPRQLVVWDLWWTKWLWDSFSPSTSVSLANVYSTNFSTITITYHPGLVPYASSGRSTQSSAAEIKKKIT